MDTHNTIDNIILKVDISNHTGYPIIFQHGLTGDANQTAEVFPDDNNFCRITLECRGHGDSMIGNVKKFSIADFAEDLIEFLLNRNLKKVIIGGISMGAAVALRVAVLKPDIITGLILARPAWVTSSSPKNMKPFLEVAELLHKLPVSKALNSFLKSEIAIQLSTESPDNLLSLKNIFYRSPQNITSALIKAIANDGPGISDNEVRKIKIPTLIIGNHYDKIHPLEYATTLSKMIKTSNLVVITSKSINRDLYIAEFRNSLNLFLKELV